MFDVRLDQYRLIGQGVPHSYILGPFPLLIFTSLFCKYVSISKFQISVDNTQLYHTCIRAKAVFIV